MADEFDLIARYFRPLSNGAPEAFGLLDDAALVPSSDGNSIVVTTDTIVAGVHFLSDDSPQNVAAKLSGSNLSDLAAMGTKPVGFTLSCAWPRDIDARYIENFADGLREWVETYGFPVLGGDTVTTDGPLVLTMTAFGHAPDGNLIRRNGAQAGDRVYVTGTIGDAALGLLVAKGELNCSQTASDFLDQRYRRPSPRIPTGLANAGRVNAGIDISDGLVQDIGHIAAASGVRIVLDVDRIPLSEAATEVLAREPRYLSTILGGGDDYELALCSSEPPVGGDTQVTEIGWVEAGASDVRLIDETGKAENVTISGYNHFASENRES